MRFSNAVAVAVVAVAVAFTGSAHAASWYVATSGSDSANGSQATPFRTIGKAAGIVRAGDVVNVRGGVYNETVSINAAGTAAARIVFRSNPGEKAIVDGAGLGKKNVITLGSKASFVDVSGFEVRNAGQIGICAWGANNVRILDNEVHDSFRNGIYIGWDVMGVSADNVIDGNTVFHNVQENRNRAFPNGGWATGISINQSVRSRATNNRVYENDGEGIVTILSQHTVIEGNELSDNFSVGVYVDNARFVKVNANLIYSTGNSSYYRTGYPASGMATANESYNQSLPSSDNTFTNNIVINARWGFFYGAFENGGGLKNAVVANNTFYKAASTMIWIEKDSHANNVFENNIFYQVGGKGMLDVTGGGVTYRNNVWYGAPASFATPTDVIADPKFANAGGFKAVDYKLTPFSPAVSSGVAVASIVPTDFFGAARSTTFDIGAHQLTGNGNGSAPSTPSLNSPANLTATATGTRTIHLTWSPSPIAAVQQYAVYRDGALVATVTGTEWNDADLSPNTTYTYQVTATLNGSESPRSIGVPVKTNASNPRRRSVGV